MARIEFSTRRRRRQDHDALNLGARSRAVSDPYCCSILIRGASVSIHGKALGDARQAFAFYRDNTRSPHSRSTGWRRQLIPPTPNSSGSIPCSARSEHPQPLNQGLNDLGAPARAHRHHRLLSLLGCFLSTRLRRRALLIRCLGFLSMRGRAADRAHPGGDRTVLKRPVGRSYLLTRFDRRRNMSYETRSACAMHFGDELCETVISENVCGGEAPQ